MGLSASQARMLLLTARKSDLEYRAQSISRQRQLLAQEQEEASIEYENAVSNRQMNINLMLQNADQSGNGYASSKVANLTYKTLVSGTTKTLGIKDSGIQPSKEAGTNFDNQTNYYGSNAYYRLVDADGAIVVSDVSEIPNVITTSTTKSAKTKVEGFDKLYYTGNKEITVDTSGQSVENDKSVGYTLLLEPPKTTEGTTEGEEATENQQVNTLSKALVESGKNEVEIDMANKLIRFEGTIYNLDGVAVETPGEFNAEEKLVKVVTQLARVPELTTKTTKSAGTEDLEIGRDGKTTLKDKNGVEVQRYVIDPSLALGSTDDLGSISGPNYLQDCLRNGKYLIQQGSMQENGDDIGVIWSSLSWDATGNITDSYYTEDDDKAKAKYDRILNQVQAKDKKLELELDQIETDRSAITTEEESVQKVIDENIEGTFNAFA